MKAKRSGYIRLAASALMVASAIAQAVPAGASTDAQASTSTAIHKWCADLQDAVKKFKWKTETCEGIEWKTLGTSIEGRPLTYVEFGDPGQANTTLIFTMVHGDEITPLYLGLKLIEWLKTHQKDSPKAHVVIAPLVNPDAFFRTPRTRFNARGVDVNRNFPTRDWNERALKAWKTRFRSDPRRFPGSKPESEPETLFQEELIRKVRPQKILSIHAPLNFMDYDGPTTLSLTTFPREYVRECLKLRQKLRAISSGFFPGSLGNFAGQELGIPTLTLELPTADPAKADGYWQRFSTGIRTMIDFIVPNTVSRQVFQAENHGSQS